MPDDVPDVWINDFSGLDVAGAKLLGDLLGAESMTLEMLTGNAA